VPVLPIPTDLASMASASRDTARRDNTDAAHIELRIPDMRYELQEARLLP